jgi:DNA (cytosine-5)-methyltransferase 1
MRGFGDYVADGTASAIKRRDYKDATDLVAEPHAIYSNESRCDNIPPAGLSPPLKIGSNSGGNPPAVAIGFDGFQSASPKATHQLTIEGTGPLIRNRPHCVATLMAVRRLTPRECERLQGFPDDYTLVEYRKKPAADGPRYRALGNSMAVPVMRWIGERMAMVEGMQ